MTMSEKEKQTLVEKVKAIGQKMTGKKKLLLLTAGAAGIVAVSVFAYTTSRKEDSWGQMMGQMGQRPSVSGNNIMNTYVTASGTTSLGYTMDEFEPDYIETELYIEEVYLSSGDEVEAGTAVFKVSDESIAKARAELEEKKEETSLAYRAGVISYEQSKINAKYTYDAAVLEGKQAEAVYQSAVKSAEKKLQTAKDNVADTESKLEEYQDANADYYYDYNVDEYKERYETNFSFYHYLIGLWGIGENEIGGTGNTLSGSPPAQNATDENYTRKVQTLQQQKKNMENSQKYYYNAWNEYEATASQATAQIQKLELQKETMRADLAEAETDYQLEVLEAETAYKKALAQSQLAKSDYDAAIQKAEDELETLKDEKEEAEKNLAEFESLLGDGYFYTKNAGTVMMIGTRSESNLQGGSMVVAYRNAQDISITVSVAQEDIHKLKVGDSAQVMIEEYGTFEGRITYLNPISNSSSRTNITYEVMVDLEGDNISSLKENLTATVVFQTGESNQ